MADLHVFPTAAALFDAVAEEFVADVERVLAVQERYAWVLAGGTTPRAVYERVRVVGERRGLPWQRLDWFWGDERGVAPDDPASNYGMARDALLGQVPVAAERVFRMRGELPAEEAASEYEERLQRHAATRGDLPLFDWVLLGLGADGHTASLFPGGSWALQPHCLVLAQTVAGQLPRLSLTPRALESSRRVVFLVSGASKADALKAVLEAEWSPEQWPAQAIVRSASGGPSTDVSLWLDVPAGALLSAG
jgi:6-phosphogluconolactonase